MKPPTIPLEKITALNTVHRITIPPEYQDENGHMNIRWYMSIFDDAGYPVAESLGLTPDYHRQHTTGGFDLEHHVHYLNEVLIGDTVSVYLRLVGRSAKRIHYMMFMVNETRGTLAALFECVNSFADLKIRRTAAYPDEISQKIDVLLAQHNTLDWAAPVCGVMSA
ncbi:MAG: thioesterase family protein [Chloroflexi bacterium]|nr:thioesterase family protein [Chloroflexota bacterium]